MILFTPPFDKSPVDPGYIKGYVPGVRENGGQYTHAALWMVIAYAMLGEGDSSLVRMNRYLDAPRYMEPNTFYAEAGPVIETPLAAAATLQELVLEDWGGALQN